MAQMCDHHSSVTCMSYMCLVTFAMTTLTRYTFVEAGDQLEYHFPLFH